MKKDRHPTKKQVQKIIDALTKVLPAAKKLDRKKALTGKSVYMGECHIYAGCGTPMCHAGWFAVSKEIYLGTNEFDRAASVMAESLGFDEHSELENWACQNPDIWGNEYGVGMFICERAFNYKGDLTLGKIITHWKGVQKRLPR